MSGRPLFPEELDAVALVVRGLLDRTLPPAARAARTIAEHETWKEFGYARAGDFCRERFGRSGRWLRRLAAIGRALARSAELELAVTGDDGGPPLGREAAYQLARLPENTALAPWIAFARRASVRVLQRTVREALAGEREAPPAPEAGTPEDRSLDREGTPEEPGAGTSSGHEDTACAAAGEDAEGRARVTLRLPVAGAVLACWEEVFDLHRRVCGAETGVVSFVEALVAEAESGPLREEPRDDENEPRPDPLEEIPWRRWRSPRARWRIPVDPLPDEEREGWIDVRELREVLGLLPALGRAAGGCDPVAAADALEGLLDVEERAQRIFGVLLQEMADQWGFLQLGFRNIEEYAEKRLGMSGAAVRERVFLERRLVWHPHWRQAYWEGRIGAQKLLVLVRGLRDEPLDEASERAWLELAEQVTCRRLQDEIRAVRRERWLSRGPRRVPLPGDDARWQRSQRRGYGTTLDHVWEAAETLVHDGFPAAMLTLRLPRDLARSFLSVLSRIEPRREWIARLEELRRAAEPEAGDPWTFSAPWADRSFSWRLLYLLLGYAEQWDRAPDGSRRAEQEIYERDGWRCQSPGCTSRRNLEAHHVVYRSRGGDDAPENLVTLCRFHHQRGEHGDLLRVRGAAPLEVVFTLGRDGIGGIFRNDRRLPDAPPVPPPSSGPRA
ncbi:MAG: HNH endonuclease [Acidobacteria bacterium]|nr:MAG: HNH endonuclease [Acidobacteriota bacterium]